MLGLGEMTAQHAIYIPSVILLGLIIGYIAGSRATRTEYERQRERMKK